MKTLKNEKVKEALSALYEASLEALKVLEKNGIVNNKKNDHALPLDFESLPTHIAISLHLIERLK